VAQPRHGDPPLPCGGLIFGRDKVSHLVDCHNVPPGPMSSDDPDMVYTLVQEEKDPWERRTRGKCQCGEERLPMKRICGTCRDLGLRVPVAEGRMSNAEALRIYRAHAISQGLCSTCRKRETAPESKTCEKCQTDRRERARANKGGV
jgi:hypothetical protein